MSYRLIQSIVFVWDFLRRGRQVPIWHIGAIYYQLQFMSVRVYYPVCPQEG